MTKHRLALLPLAVTIGVFAFIAWAAITLAQPPIPHAGPESPGEPGKFSDCLFCHQSGVVGSPRVVSDHTAYSNDDCLTCHEFLMHADAAFAHSDLLVGAHIDLWCEDCHASVQRPGQQCSDCHAPPTEPHFGTVCEDCHTPAGFAEADPGEFEHPVSLVGSHAQLDCAACHVADQELNPECASCHVPPTEPHFGTACEECHTPAGFGEADVGSFEHPVDLEGAHAEADCAACHAEGRELTFECGECHMPPSEPHFGSACEECHTPVGFDEVNLSGIEHPVELEGAHAEATCSACHAETRELTFDCAECHQPPSVPHYGTACEECHTPTAFQDASLPENAHPVPLIGAHEGAACEGCHDDDQGPPEFVCSNCHEPPEDHLTSECDVCHTPEGFAASAESIVDQAPVIPHTLEGRDDCMLCHDPEGQVLPAPSNHIDLTNEQCILCHKAAP